MSIELRGAPEEKPRLIAIKHRKGIFNSVYHFFTSTRLALILILILTGLSLVGTLAIQAPAEVRADPAIYNRWLQAVVQPRFQVLTGPLSLLGVFDIFHSPWFLLAWLLLIANVVVCSLNRWKTLRAIIRGGAVKLAPDFYKRGEKQATIELEDAPAAESIGAVAQVLKRHGYRLRTQEDSGAIYLAADKNRFPRLGTYLSHLSIILAIIGFLVGNYFGFSSSSFVVAEGQMKDVGFNTGLSLFLESFVDDYYPDGTPKDYQSQVTLYKGQSQVERGTIRVNAPMEYNGVRFYQSYYGPAILIEVRNQAGDVIHEENVPLVSVSQNAGLRRYYGTTQISGTDLSLRIVSPAIGQQQDPLLEPDQLLVMVYQESQGAQGGADSYAKVKVGEDATLSGLQIRITGAGRFSGFQIKSDPGLPIVWTAAALFVLGLSLVFYFPHRQFWAMLATEDQRTSLMLRALSPRSLGSASDFDELKKQIEKELQQEQEESELAPNG